MVQWIKSGIDYFDNGKAKKLNAEKYNANLDYLIDQINKHQIVSINGIPGHVVQNRLKRLKLDIE